MAEKWIHDATGRQILAVRETGTVCYVDGVRLLAHDAAQEAAITRLMQERDEARELLTSARKANAPIRQRAAQAEADRDRHRARAEQAEAERDALRKLVWLRHGCSFVSLYGDDGEMQCHTCRLDFKRMTPEQIEQRWMQQGLAALAPEQETKPVFYVSCGYGYDGCDGPRVVVCQQHAEQGTLAPEQEAQHGE